MSKQILEYIWLDNNQTVEGKQLRSKTKIIDTDKPYDQFFGQDISRYPIWSFDGSSTNQAKTSESELYLKPVKAYKDPFRKNGGLLVLCEVCIMDDKGFLTPHVSNTRNLMVDTAKHLDDKEETWYGFEQEYIIMDPKASHPVGLNPTVKIQQGDYYCGVGHENVSVRNMVEEHMQLCLNIGLNLSGINAEVLKSQWEYQLGPVKAIEGCDDLWISRWVLKRLSENYGYKVVFDPKPIKGKDANGSGMHVNFSTLNMRNSNPAIKVSAIELAISKLESKHKEHMLVYGNFNECRLSGENETCDINTFKFGYGDRTASIRIPNSVKTYGPQGYIEDRRPASNGDPYMIVTKLLQTILG